MDTQTQLYFQKSIYMYQFSFSLGPFKNFMYLKNSEIAPHIKYVGNIMADISD